MEKTLVLIKPDGVKRGLVGEIIRRYEMKGLKILEIKSVVPTKELAEKHYEEHRGKDFFDKLVDYLTSGMVIAMVLEGENAIKCVRLINGATKYQDAVPGTIRGDFAYMETYNLVHASDCEVSADREIKLWFE